MRALRFIGRGFWVGMLLLIHGVIWFAGWLALLVALRPRAVRRDWFAERLTELLIALGATFVKVGQIMSTRPDLFPPHIIRALTRLQDDVGAFAWKHVEQICIEELGAPPDALFASFDRTPVASASVAQVHRATLASGEEVAVKVRRPGLDDLVAFDLWVMRAVARVTELIPSMRMLAPVESVDQFGAAIRAQIDLRIEARNNQRFTENFAGDPDVGFPPLYPELSGRQILTMGFIRGAKILEAPAKVGADPCRLARAGLRTLLQMIFQDGFVHADLHPGNLLVDEHGRVFILDLGLTAELDDTARRGFTGYFASWAAGDGVTTARIVAEHSPGSHVVDYAAYERDMVEFVRRYHGKSLGDVQVSTVAFDMLNILRRHRVRANPVYTMCNIAIAVTEGIGKQLDPKLDLVQEALPFFAKLQAVGRL